jgi:hypothetical protein
MFRFAAAARAPIAIRVGNHPVIIDGCGSRNVRSIVVRNINGIPVPSRFDGHRSISIRLHFGNPSAAVARTRQSLVLYRNGCEAQKLCLRVPVPRRKAILPVRLVNSRGFYFFVHLIRER